MLTRLRTRWFAGGAALLLILAMSGAAFAADNAGESAGPSDADGTTALVIVSNRPDCDNDTDPDESDADESTETDVDEATVTLTSEVDENDQGENEQGDDNEQGENEQGDGCDATDPAAPEAKDEQESESDTEDAAKADVPCVEVPAPPFDPAIFNGPGAFGAYVSSVATSDAVGGKNCNHGGAVSAAVKAAKAAARAERDAAKSAAKAERDAAKAERQTNKTLAKAVRNATKQSKGKGHGNGH